MKKYKKDYGLSAYQLDDKYNPDGGGEHPYYTRRDWREAVDQRDTLSGYWDWLVSQLEQEEND